MMWWAFPLVIGGTWAAVMTAIFQGPKAYRKAVAFLTPKSAITPSVTLTVSLLDNSPEEWREPEPTITPEEFARMKRALPFTIDASTELAR